MNVSKQSSNNQVKKEYESDKFCWNCHGDGTTLFCSTCALSFHNSTTCLDTRNLSTENIGLWKCVECIAIEKDKEWLQVKEIDAQYLKRLLDGAVDSFTSMAPESAAKFPNELAKIGDKVNSGLYMSLEEFLLDVKRIAYNVNVNRIQNDAKHKAAVKAAKTLIKQTEEDLYQIRMCPDCYLNLNQSSSESDSFMMVCKQPHLLVWVRISNSYPQWPAKFMIANPNTKKVDVVYFGTYHRAVMESNQCTMFSKSNLSAIRSKDKKLLEQALQEASKYIENVKAKFGKFNYASERTPLNIEHLDRHLYDTIPNAWALLKKPIPPPIPPIPVSQRKQEPALRSVQNTEHTAEPQQRKRGATRPLSPHIETNENIDQNARQTIQEPSNGDNLLGPVRERIRLLEEENAKLTTDLADSNSTIRDLNNQCARLTNKHKKLVGTVKRIRTQIAAQLGSDDEDI